MQKGEVRERRVRQHKAQARAKRKRSVSLAGGRRGADSIAPARANGRSGGSGWVGLQPGGYISCAATTTSRTRVGQRRCAVCVFTSHGKLAIQPVCSPATANWPYSQCVHQPRQTGLTASVFTSHGKLGLQPVCSPAMANWPYRHWVLTILHKASYCATACHNNVCHNTTTRCVI